MKFMVRRYFSCYSTYHIEAENSSEVYQISKKIPVDEIEILDSLDEWEDCDEVIPEDND